MSSKLENQTNSRLQSRCENVIDSFIHYLECGSGDPIVFLHGMPTSSFLWRHIMPTLSTEGRCIAPDLIGMGASGKPDIDYSVYDHIAYMEAFLDQVVEDQITLVLHGWGSVVGFELARRHPERIKALAFFESHVRATTDWNMLSLPVQQLASLLKHPEASYRAVVKQNILIKKLLPSGAVSSLSEDVLSEYEKPFSLPEYRQPLWQYVQELPIGHNASPIVDLIVQYSAWLQQTPLPKLMMYAVPGFITTIDTVQWARDHLKNMTLVSLEDAMHFPQETIPEEFSAQLLQWHQSITAGSM